MHGTAWYTIGMEEKTCVDCGETKSVEEFPPYPGGKYRRKRCNPCYAVDREQRLVSMEGTYRACEGCGATKPVAEFHRLKHRGYQRRCKECGAASAKRWRSGLKLYVIAKYGGRCQCCGETEAVFLVIDHVNGDGAAHRKHAGNSYQLYVWLRDHEKSDKFRVLCHNCNFAEFWGGCPHQDKEDRA